MLKLDAENWLISFDTNEGGGNTRVVVVRTEDGGNSWSDPITAVNEVDGNSANGQMLLLPSGDVWLAYRKVVESGGQVHTSLRVKQSSDAGETWGDLPQGSVIVEESAPNFKGVWEPHLELINGEIVVLYADDGPNAVGATNHQNLYMKQWTESGWGERITISDGVAAGSRDGMPVITRMNDGRYMTIFEASDVPGHPFVIKFKISNDGFNWDGPREHLYTPIEGGKKAGAPFVITLSDGGLVAAFQTDENSSNTGDAYTSMHTMVADSNGENWAHKSHTFQVPSTNSANWNSLMVVDSTHIVAATSSNYPVNSIYIRHGYTAMPPATNLVNNGSFESGNILGWRTYGRDFPERIHLVQNENIERSATDNGDYYISLSGISEPRSAYIGQSISKLDDGTYTLTAQMRSSGGQNTCVMEVKDYGGDIRSIACPTTDDWTTVTLDNIPVSSGTATIGFFVTNSSAEQWVDIDQIQFSIPTELTEDVVAPAWPNDSSVSSSNVSQTGLTLNWTSAEDDVAVTQYKVTWQDRNKEAIVSGDTLSLNVTDLQAATNYTFKIDAADEAGNWSEDGPSITVRTSGSSYTPPAQLEQPQPPVVEEEESEAPEEQQEQPPIVFKDVPAGHWAESAIKQAASLNIIKGHPDNFFKPNSPATRAEFMVMLSNAFKWDNEKAPLAFNDSDQIGTWATDAIAQGIQLGIISGYPDASFRPNQKLTRSEMIVLLARALELTINDIEHTSFADDASIPSWSKGAVEALRELGIINGRENNNFASNETATRAEALVIIMRVLNNK
ncbi:hypothetical protein BK133_15525 [Paenibacillus sp. FSL H8-0548]|nr:hypothetical protein BK133_15525 [Paenibacillus sp. FSL H8-0548]